MSKEGLYLSISEETVLLSRSPFVDIFKKTDTCDFTGSVFCVLGPQSR